MTAPPELERRVLGAWEALQRAERRRHRAAPTTSLLGSRRGCRRVVATRSVRLRPAEIRIAFEELSGVRERSTIIAYDNQDPAAAAV
jgi:hypothetical protein